MNGLSVRKIANGYVVKMHAEYSRFEEYAFNDLDETLRFICDRLEDADD